MVFLWWCFLGGVCVVIFFVVVWWCFCGVGLCFCGGGVFSSWDELVSD